MVTMKKTKHKVYFDKPLNELNSTELLHFYKTGELPIDLNRYTTITLLETQTKWQANSHTKQLWSVSTKDKWSLL